MPSGSWPRRLSGQEESLKGCTGEKDQVHPGRPERGEVKWRTQATVIRAPNEREQPRGLCFLEAWSWKGGILGEC